MKDPVRTTRSSYVELQSSIPNGIKECEYFDEVGFPGTVCFNQYVSCAELQALNVSDALEALDCDPVDHRRDLGLLPSCIVARLSASWPDFPLRLLPAQGEVRL